MKGRELSIQTKLVLIIIFLNGLPFLIFGFVWYQYSTRSIEQTAVTYSMQLMQQTSRQLDSYFETLEQTTFPFITNPLIQNFGRIDPSDNYNRIQYTRQIQEQLLTNLIFGRPDITNAAILTVKGISTSVGGGTTRAQYKDYLNDGSEEGNFTITGISKEESKPVISVYRRFLDVITFKPAGIIILDLNLNELMKITKEIKLGKTGYVVVLDQKDFIVLHPDRNMWVTKAENLIPASFRDNPDGYFIDSSEGKNNLVTFHRSPFSKWSIVSVVPIEEMMGDMVKLRNVSIIVAILLISAALTAVIAFAFRVSRSLRHLKRLMKRAEQGDLSVQATEHSNDEIGSLVRSFNKMVVEIRRLIEFIRVAELKEKELQIQHRNSQLLALQSQINPHFLYNTLETVNALALIDGNVKINRIVAALGDMFRYNVGSFTEHVTLEDELDHAQKYLLIQKERYSGLNVSISMEDPSPYQVIILRFTLQPLIENAFVHGYYGKKLKPSFIGITGTVDGENYIITVIDHGLGMPQETRQQLNDAFSLPNLLEPLKKQGIGLWNVHYRLREHFGAQYCLYIEHSDESGTRIKVKLPLNR